MITATPSKTPWAVAFTNGTHRAVADTTPDKGGGNAGFRPHELLEAALASCMTMTLSMCAAKMGLSLFETTLQVQLDRSRREQPVFRVAVSFAGNLSPAEKAALLAELDHCPVRKTLSSKLAFAVTESTP